MAKKTTPAADVQTQAPAVNTTKHEPPKQGGSYVRNADGSLTKRDAQPPTTTKE